MLTNPSLFGRFFEKQIQFISGK